MKQRNILIVDDNSSLWMDIEEYQEICEGNANYADYTLVFHSQNSISEAKKFLETGQVIDVLIIDYNFTNSTGDENGSNLIAYVREKINKHCKIIFYTMQAITNIQPEDYVRLLNCGVYRMINKADISQEDFVDIIFKAAIDCDPIILSLERFWEQYSPILEDYLYEVESGEKIAFLDIINHIRLDDEIGRTFIEKLLHKAIIQSIEI